METWRREQADRVVTVTEEDIASIVSKWTGIPLSRLEEAETEKLLRMEEELRKTVVGQDGPVGIVSRALRRSRAALKDPRRPIARSSSSAPPGVGKTLLARVAEFMFGDEDALVQIDMSELEKFSASRLTGSPRLHPATRRAGGSPSRCGGGRTASSSSTRSKRRIPT